MRRHIVHPAFSRLAPFALCLLAGCGGGAEGTGGTGSSTTGSGATEPLTCTVPEVAQARPIAPLLIPGCSFTGGSSSTPTILRTAEEVSAALRCSGEGQPPGSALGIDMAANDVYLLRVHHVAGLRRPRGLRRRHGAHGAHALPPQLPGRPHAHAHEQHGRVAHAEGRLAHHAASHCSLPERCD
jgi:hypothetical protein